MRRAALSLLLLASSLGAAACDGREVAVFEVPAHGGLAGSGGSAGSSPDTGGSSTEMKAPPAGANSGGAMGGAGLGAGGSAGASASASTAGGGGTGNGGGGMQGSGGAPPTPCMSDADCSGWRCEKQGCDAVMGFCEPSPVFCPPDPTPVCGCDGVTYWNDCLRRQSGAQISAPDQCRITACACEVGSDCKVLGASCSHLVAPGEMCGHGMGACWVLPPQCPPNVDTQMWQECKGPDAPPGPCTDTCNAILSEKSYAPPHRGMTCN